VEERLRRIQEEVDQALIEIGQNQPVLTVARQRDEAIRRADELMLARDSEAKRAEVAELKLVARGKARDIYRDRAHTAEHEIDALKEQIEELIRERNRAEQARAKAETLMSKERDEVDRLAKQVVNLTADLTELRANHLDDALVDQDRLNRITEMEQTLAEMTQEMRGLTCQRDSEQVRAERAEQEIAQLNDRIGFIAEIETGYRWNDTRTDPLPCYGQDVLVLVHLGWRMTKGDQYGVHIAGLDREGTWWSAQEGRELRNVCYWAQILDGPEEKRAQS